MEKLVIVTQQVDCYLIQEVETISYESKEKFMEDWALWYANTPERVYWDRFQNTAIIRRMVNDLCKEDSFDVYTLEEFFQERKVN